METVNKKDIKFGDYHFSTLRNGGLVVTSLKDVSLGINDHECFGLLGPNGSGKSTLLNIIAYNITQSVGKVYFDGIDNKKIKEDHYMIGFCPQNDTLWDEFTLYEHLIMYINLRGFSKKECKKYANMYMKFCRIEEHKNKYPHELSGGTRRKLCIIISLICFSNKVVLDEPSSGMDPATRRYIWNILTNYKNNENSSIVITTHSMEEAEILCDRIGILVNGELHALGSPTHVKMKYGNTYTLEINCSDSKLIDKHIKNDIPMLNEKDVICEIKSNKRIKYTFKIMENYSEVFRIMKYYKSKNLVTYYGFNQTNLEDVFLKFANLQENKEME
ncbi:P-loop containing nucleoside triphosphate hydrolase protein [Anaeromyces robustus]|uniref:p-loop containing nucleoside triphosphate hydrolase protein n=1 Tax=Anaeromyces robustus TaxID=1754192 RepID=A0A1Y1XPS4_9FUNG|nr:P-loop containing nucleoside triphosphate hydrolase protein [Anaeromyces robustus]|eukprot:ORX87324.1 P-loop containing nucleoside triphosphate hydrolase protein [Anaeromyces robustus]